MELAVNERRYLACFTHFFVCVKHYNKNINYLYCVKFYCIPIKWFWDGNILSLHLISVVYVGGVKWIGFGRKLFIGCYQSLNTQIAPTINIL